MGRNKKFKAFRINPVIAREFEIACKLLGVTQSEIIEGLIREWNWVVMNRSKIAVNAPHEWRLLVKEAVDRFIRRCRVHEEG